MTDAAFQIGNISSPLKLPHLPDTYCSYLQMKAFEAVALC